MTTAPKDPGFRYETPASRADRAAGFTLVETAISLAIIAVLTALILSASGTARSRVASVQCQANMRQLGTAICGYVADNDGAFPISSPSSPWDARLIPYLQAAGTNSPLKVLRCPQDPRPLVVNAGSGQYARSYSMSSIREGFFTGDGIVNGSASRRISQLTQPSRTILLMENYTTSAGAAIGNYQFGYNWSHIAGWLGGSSQAPRLPGGRPYHGKTMNFCFADGHVEALPPEQANTPENLWTAVRD